MTGQGRGKPYSESVLKKKKKDKTLPKFLQYIF